MPFDFLILRYNCDSRQCHKQPMTGNGLHYPTYIFMVMTGGWCKWHCFNHINRIYMEPPSTFRKPAISTIQYDLRPSHHRPPWQRGSGSERCTLARVPSSTLGIQPSVRIQDIHNQKNIHNHIFIFRLIFIYIYIYFHVAHSCCTS